MILNLSNAISFLRGPLALVFWSPSPVVRVWVVCLAMISDCCDGYLARRLKCTSKFGAVLDPIMDKFFVYVTLSILLAEGHLSLLAASAMLSRDVALVLFGGYLTLTKTWKTCQFRSILWGKVSTACQFICLIILSLGFTIPSIWYATFGVFAILAFFELLTLVKNPSHEIS